MEYHEIGERFEYDGVMLEVMKGDGQSDCNYCYMWQRHCKTGGTMYCGKKTRADNQPTYYKLVEQCKTKENNNMKKQIYYADLTPCDNMRDYKEVAFVPQFVLDDTKEFDTEPPIGVVQMATHLGWCIVAKW